ncbi:putative GPI anchored protein [Aspergillus mulundensis]|uniref:Iron-sulfur cluster assembly protein n=1 Tax=Aspergillus mulundensis TaxID=1810919 RepID=A0A3D8REX8_9EURO|nr:Uncharacterized protein DSM5745_07606 [Aspergillus mulundensis]RDW72434.1 Uncharacterized protein DSM5745_07606 [Aspergillus mulundensis]
MSSKLNARAENNVITLDRNSSFDYVADDNEGELVFSTTLHVESEWPILRLEDLDTGLDSVSCTASEIQLQFISIAAEENFRSGVEETPEFVIVTSHEGCDLEGERSAHRVTSISANPEGNTITLKSVPIDWHVAFSATKVSFSHMHSSEIQKRNPTPVKRQNVPSPTPSFPVAPSEVDGLNSTARKTFNVTHPGLQIYPVDNALASEVMPQLPVVVRCKTCTLQGDIQLSKGQFTAGEKDEDDSEFDFELDEAIEFFTNSSIELLVKQMFSQIELELELASEGPLIELSTALPAIGLTPFQIAGVITFGPMIVPEIIITADLEGDVGFSYGFNVTVPDNSRVLIRIPNFNESEITGFEDTTFETLPFETTTEVTSMALSITFQPQILLGINTGIGSRKVNIDGGIGAFVSLPTLSLNVSRATGVNENCEAVTVTDDAIGNATLLIPSVELDVGAIARYDVEIVSWTDSREVATVLTSTARKLPTACVGFEPEIKATSKAGDSAGDATAGGGSDDGGNGAANLGGNEITLVCALVFSTVAVGFCGWAPSVLASPDATLSPLPWSGPIMRKIRSFPDLGYALKANCLKLIDHYSNPRNVGSLNRKSIDVGTGLVGAPACGDVIRLDIQVDEATGKITETRFKTFGCGSAIASSSYLTTLLKGKTLEEASKISNTQIASELCLPPVKLHCSLLAEDAVTAAIKNYRSKRVTPATDLSGTAKEIPKEAMSA